MQRRRRPAHTHRHPGHPRVEIIAHRGASHHAPENTLTAVHRAWAEGAAGVEVDVHLSRDGRIVVIHDDNTHRTAGVDRPVVQQSLADLRSLDVGRWKGPLWAGEKIPTLEEVLAAVPSGRRLFVEIKCGVQLVPVLARVLAQAAQTQVVLIGASFTVMKTVKQRLPDHEVLWVLEFLKTGKDASWARLATWLVRQAAGAGLDGFDLDVAGRVDARFVEQARAAGLKSYVWTVDSREVADQLARAGVDGITTNRPGYLRQRPGSDPWPS